MGYIDNGKTALRKRPSGTNGCCATCECTGEVDGGDYLKASPKCQQLMKGFLQARGFQDENDNIQCLNDFKQGETVTSADLQSSIARLKEDAKAGDVLFFYFTGHGGLNPDTGENCLFLSDDVTYDADLERFTYPPVSVYDLKEQLTKDVPPGVTIIVVLDC